MIAFPVASLEAAVDVMLDHLLAFKRDAEKLKERCVRLTC